MPNQRFPIRQKRPAACGVGKTHHRASHRRRIHHPPAQHFNAIADDEYPKASPRRRQNRGILAANAATRSFPFCHSLPRKAWKSVSTPNLAGSRSTVQLRIKAPQESRQNRREMEALTAVSIAALTVYDMCKAIDKTMLIAGSSC